MKNINEPMDPTNTATVAKTNCKACALITRNTTDSTISATATVTEVTMNEEGGRVNSSTIPTRTLATQMSTNPSAARNISITPFLFLGTPLLDIFIILYFNNFVNIKNNPRYISTGVSFRLALNILLLRLDNRTEYSERQQPPHKCED